MQVMMGCVPNVSLKQSNTQENGRLPILILVVLVLLCSQVFSESCQDPAGTCCWLTGIYLLSASSSPIRNTTPELTTVGSDSVVGGTTRLQPGWAFVDAKPPVNKS